jgi:hypothetical protein
MYVCMYVCVCVLRGGGGAEGGGKGVGGGMYAYAYICTLTSRKGAPGSLSFSQSIDRKGADHRRQTAPPLPLLKKNCVVTHRRMREPPATRMEALVRPLAQVNKYYRGLVG